MVSRSCFHDLCIKIVLAFTCLYPLLPIYSQDPNAVPLNHGKAVERELKGAAAHTYSIELQTGQFVELVVEQKGIDVVVTVFDPSGKKIEEVDSPNGTQGPEPVGFISESAGNYRVEVRSLEPSAAAGLYQINVINIRASNPTDKGLLTARKLYAEAFILRMQPSVESLRAAVKKYNDALPLFRAAGNDVGETDSLNNLGYAYGMLGENQNALEFFRKAAIAAHNANRPAEEAISYGNIATIYSRTGENQKAIETFDQMLNILTAAKVQDLRIRAFIYNNVGTIYLELNELAKALDNFDKAFAMFSALGDRRMCGISLGNAGVAHQKLGENEKAIEKYSKALEIQRALGDTAEIGRLLGNIGTVYRGMKNYDKAIAYMSEALPIIRASGNRGFEATGLGNLGSIYGDKGEYAKGIEYMAQALALHQVMGDRSGEARVLSNLFVLFNSAKQGRMAVFLGKRSVNTYQELRSSVQGLDKNTQKAFLQSFDGVYRRTGAELAEQNRFAETQRLLNLFKDQQYFDLRSSTGSVGMMSLTQRETELSAGLDEMVGKAVVSIQTMDQFRNSMGGQQPDAAKMAAYNALLNKQASAQNDLVLFINEAARQFAEPPGEKDKDPAISDLKATQEMLKETSGSSKSPAAVVYTLVSNDGYKAIVITPDKTFAVSSPFANDLLNKKSQQLWQLLRTPKYDPRPLSKEIYDMVFAPIEKRLPAGTKTILWSLDGNLRYLPIAALYDGKRYMAERYNNVVFTRADEERMNRPQSKEKSGSGFGSSEALTVELLGTKFNASELPSVRSELARIFKSGQHGVIPGKVLLDRQFSKASMIEALKARRPIVHIASHFKFEPGDEALSFLLMGDGTPFTLDDMKTQTDLFSGVDLLTLSACATAAQKPDANGREVDGFAELAQRLGAGAVMASLWEVSDGSTAELMARFYQNYAHVGANKASALRMAQIALLKGEYKTKLTNTRQLTQEDVDAEKKIKVDVAKLRLYKTNPAAPFAHPFYWSPFILIGNWK